MPSHDCDLRFYYLSCLTQKPYCQIIPCACHRFCYIQAFPARKSDGALGLHIFQNQINMIEKAVVVGPSGHSMRQAARKVKTNRILQQTENETGIN